MKRFWMFVTLLLLVLGAGIAEAQTAPDQQEAICLQTWVFSCENWDARAPGVSDWQRATYKNIGWSTGGWKWSIVSGQGVNGTNGIRVDCDAHGPGLPPDAGDPNNGCGSYLVWDYGSFVPDSTRTIYLRWYTLWSTNFVPGPAAEKHMIIQYGNGPFTQGIHAGWKCCGGQPSWFYISHFDKTYTPNTGPPWTRANNRWYCYEAKVTMSTSPTATDGSIEEWIDNVQVMNYQNIQVNKQTGMIHSLTLISAYYNCVDNIPGSGCQDPRDAHPAMSRYHDNFVGGFQRIGCLGSPPPPPNNTVLTPISPAGEIGESSQATAGWQGVTNAVTYQLRVTNTTNGALRATSPVSNCTDAIYLCLNGINALSQSFNVTPGHSYQYTVKAADGGGAILTTASAAFSVQAGALPPPDPPPPQQEAITWLTFDEASGTAQDVGLGGGNHCQMVGNPTRVPGIINTGLGLSGSGQYCVATANNMPANELDKSFTFYGYHTSVPPAGQSGVAFAVFTNSGGFSGLFCGFHNGLFPLGHFGCWKSGGPGIGSAPAPSANAYHAYALKFTASPSPSWVFKVDDVTAWTSTVAPQTGLPTRITVGGTSFGTPGIAGEFWPGRIDEFKGYNRPITDAEITTHFNVMAGGAARIVRIGSDGSSSSIPTAVTQGQVDTLAPIAANPADFPGLASTSHTFRVTQVPNFAVAYGSCTYAVGGAECNVSSHPVTPTCANNFCEVTATIDPNVVTKGSFRYTSIGPIGAPTTLNLNQVTGSSSIQLSWVNTCTNCSDALPLAGISIERKIGIGAFSVLTTVPSGTTTYTDTTTDAATAYEYRIRAFNSCAPIPLGCTFTAYAGPVGITTAADPTDTPAPTITNVTPPTALAAATTLVTIDGTNFVSGSMVEIDGTECTFSAPNVLGATQMKAPLTCSAAAALTGRKIIVRNPDNDFAELADAIDIASAVFNLYTNHYKIVWPHSTTVTGFSVRCGKTSGSYNKITSVPFATEVLMPLVDILGPGTATWYCRTFPVYGRIAGSPSAESTLSVVDNLPTDAPIGSVE